MIYKKLRGGSAPSKKPTFFTKIGNSMANSYSNFKTRFSNTAHTLKLKAKVLRTKASLKLSEQAKKIKYIIPWRDPINLTNIELKKQKLKDLTHKLEINAKQKKNKKDSSKKAINAIAQIEKDSKKIKKIMAPHSKILGLNIRKINEYNQIKKILNKKLNDNKKNAHIDNHKKLEDAHKKKLQKLFHKMTRKYVPQASITKSILSLGISPLLNVYERRKRATGLINLDKSTEKGQEAIIEKIKKLHAAAQNTSLNEHEKQFTILGNNIKAHTNMETEIKNIEEATRKLHKQYLENPNPTVSEKKNYNNAIKTHKNNLNSKITAYINKKEEARIKYKITQKQPLYMLSNDIRKRLNTIKQTLLNTQAKQNKEFEEISTTRIMHEARKKSIENQTQQKLQNAIPLDTGYIKIGNITTNLGLSQNPNKNASLKANIRNQVPNILSESETQAQAHNAQLNALEKKYLNYNTTTSPSLPEENEYIPLKTLPHNNTQGLYALLPNNLSIPNSISPTLLKENFNKELQTNIHQKRRARIKELQEKREARLKELQENHKTIESNI